ncbi:signal peptide peptidase SppA [Ureibacillus sp. FSL K6-8385]|uniref:Signal peptide peptidase SppA n=1 Tax=Ureibacillus terrenus TaxID=118246 RepID=A0A540V0C5_9BACL|nr:signal peptide peptidase SppA [Ureibacillus terrenus]MED3662546.1 signal peptide peptidase SppA [Ureibacillus terrenus]MED3764806.1 signal peptide peptidase SppA [Ureibacillus terrenus]TQE90211.1 signal peptide peptidase SppA [Ureibacillus terrenus]
MNTKRWIALSIAVFLMVVSIGVNIVTTIFTSDFFSQFESFSKPELTEAIVEPGSFDERIALLSVDGVIQDVGSSSPWAALEYDHQRFLATLDQILEDDTVKGVVLSVNSPGGGVMESDEIYQKLMKIKEEKKIPIYVSMQSMATSGGYYISAPADKIFAHRDTVTGSIGVIIQSYNYYELAKNLGIEFETIKSGPHKDMFNGTRPSTDEEKAMMQEMINESYEAFVDVVKQGRGMSESEVKRVADGRILSGNQALRAGLVDEIGTLEETIQALRKDHGLEDATLFEYESSFGTLSSLFAMKLGTIFGPSMEERLLIKLMNSYDAPRLMYLYGQN